LPVKCPIPVALLPSPRLLIKPAALLAVALITTHATAFQPLITDDTGTQGRGGNQMEVSLNQSRTATSGVTDRIGSLPVIYTRGVTETVDVYAGLAYLRLRPGTGHGDASGAGNPSVGSKWRFLDNTADGTSAAGKLELLPPVSSSAEAAGLGSASMGGNLTLILTQEVSFGAIHVNASAGRLRYRASANNPDATPLRLSAAPVWHMDAQWKLALDLGAQWVQSGVQRLRTGYVELGGIWSPHDDVDLALGVIRTANNENPQTRSLSASAGLTWRFK
jgi:hypothetical protein